MVAVVGGARLKYMYVGGLAVCVPVKTNPAEASTTFIEPIQPHSCGLRHVPAVFNETLRCDDGCAIYDAPLAHIAPATVGKYTPKCTCLARVRTASLLTVECEHHNGYLELKLQSKQR